MTIPMAALCAELTQTHHFFRNTVACFEARDATFAPFADTYTVAQHIAHVARTVEWFIEAARSDAGFDLDFATHIAEARAVQDLDAALAWLDRSFAEGASALQEVGPAHLAAPLPPGPIMPGLPRAAVVGGIVDHSAHHRGALAVYARLCGRSPAMPYG
jgi:uncharacterized damage-inducible protein DinB